jgi:ABC-type multidrug transport system ATPase subunit
MFESTDTALSFRNIGIFGTNPLKQILGNVSGFVCRGGMTAILGPSASGKSLLMSTLSGRVHNLQVTGDFFVEGDKVDHRDISNAVGFVPQDDLLVGVLTARETLFNSSAMKRNKTLSEINADVNRILEVLNLTDVADVPIGTVFRRGLSGGQKKRVEIGTELIAAPPVLFLDEPTSGLDAYIAFELLKSVRDIARASGGRLSVMLSIHQPNSRLLELFDHILVLGNGTMNFFGTVSESIEHLRCIGYPAPRNYTPTDYFLQVSDRYFEGHGNVNFAGMILLHYDSMKPSNHQMCNIILRVILL